MMRRVARRCAVAAVAVAALVLLVAGCTSGSASGPGAASGGASPQASELNDAGQGGPYQGVGLTPPQPRPQFTLTDTGGASFSFGRATAGVPTLLYFGYTSCPDVCPTTLADIAVALGTVPAAVRQKTKVVFVTTDVRHDTGPVIAKYLAKFDRALPNPFIGLYGTQAQIDAAQVAAHVTLAEGDGQTHSASVLLYGSDDYARVEFLQSNNETAQLTHDLQLIAGKQ
jgi:protein SCO1/2